ncbi:MAG TPA: hypothetical protein VEC19_20430 [Usitatibacter sp.]|nr:hypothetical protein [Usitatibacter sp.]
MKQLISQFLAAMLLAPAAFAVQLVANPTLPTYGENVSLELRDMQAPAYLPATRYAVNGSTITLDYEYAPLGVGAPRADFGQPRLQLGELVPGNYTLQARIFRIGDPGTAPHVVTQNLAVVPPASWGLYLIPKAPEAFAPADVMLRSAAYFEPGSMRVSTNGNVIRIDFDYRGDAPAGGPVPDGMTSFAAVRLPALSPGDYTVEGWGRDKRDGVAEKYFTQTFRVDSAVNVVEYYAPATDHYFMTAAPGDIALLDAGGMGEWKRTGHKFKAWLRMGDAPPNARPVCRFYAKGPNSHFYTGDPGDCEWLKALEARERAQATASGKPFLGWAYESIAFYALMPENGQCAPGTTPVYRAYNNRADQNDSNHRFTPDPVQRSAMAMSWIDEGVAFCSPP